MIIKKYCLLDTEGSCTYELKAVVIGCIRLVKSKSEQTAAWEGELGTKTSNQAESY